MTVEMTPADLAAQADIESLRRTIAIADSDTLKLLLTEARTHYGWKDKDVTDATLKAVYDDAKMGPTSMNQQPCRFVFVRSSEAKAKLLPCLMEPNRPKAEAAPVTVIIATDMQFYTKMGEVFPINPGAEKMFADNPAMADDNAARNGTLQAAWFMIAARAHGLDVGAMSGFDPAAVTEAFLGDTNWKVNFLCNIGYGDASKVFRRLPRLNFKDVAKIV